MDMQKALTVAIAAMEEKAERLEEIGVDWNEGFEALFVLENAKMKLEENKNV